MKKNILFIFLIFPIILGGLFYKKVSFSFLYKYNFARDQVKMKKQNQEQDFSLSLVMLGDNLIHSSIYRDAYKNGVYDFRSIYEPIKTTIKDYDVAYYNQESILAGKEFQYSSYPRFNSPYEVGDALVDIGFNMVSLANNHSLDKGEKGILNTLDYWKSKNILSSGVFASQKEKDMIFIREKNHIRYGFLSYTYGTNGLLCPKGKDYLVNIWPVDNKENYENYKLQVKKDVESIRNKVDVLIVATHWGLEYQHEPSWWQKDQAQYLADLGVDIIIGTHPHVIQPVTFIDDTLVIYSLGNFLSAQTSVGDYARRIGLMTSVNINKHIDKNGNTSISLSDISNHLIFTSHQKYKNFQVIPFSQITEKELPNKNELFKKYKNIIQMYNKNMLVQ